MESERKPLNHENILNRTSDTNYVYFGSRKMILDLMKDSKPRNLRQIEELTGIGQTTASSNLKQFRLEKYGSQNVKLIDDIDGTKYQLLINEPPTKQ